MGLPSLRLAQNWTGQEGAGLSLPRAQMEAKYPAGLFLGREMTPVHLSRHPKAPILANTLPLSPCFP